MGKLTKPQRARLEKLAAYLEGLPKRYRHFDMATITSMDPDDDTEYGRHNGGIAKYGCGAVACAVGHGPAAGILVPPSFIVAGQYVDWFGYARLFTAGIPARWDWLFSGNWSDHDNSHHGAAARIRYLLDKGKPPEGFGEVAHKWRALYAPYRIDTPAPSNAS